MHHRRTLSLCLLDFACKSPSSMTIFNIHSHTVVVVVAVVVVAVPPRAEGAVGVVSNFGEGDDERQATSDKRRATSDERRATSDKR
jgi:hypothetical protein